MNIHSKERDQLIQKIQAGVKKVRKTFLFLASGLNTGDEVVIYFNGQEFKRELIKPCNGGRYNLRLDLNKELKVDKIRTEIIRNSPSTKSIRVKTGVKRSLAIPGVTKITLRKAKRRAFRTH